MQRKAKSNKNQSNWSKATKGKEKQSKTKQIKAKQWNCSAKKAISIGSIDARTSFRKELRCSIWNLGHFFASIFVHETQDSRTAFFPLCQAIRTHPRSYPGHLAWQEKFLNFCHFMFHSFQCFRFKQTLRWKQISQNLNSEFITAPIIQKQINIYTSISSPSSNSFVEALILWSHHTLMNSPLKTCRNRCTKVL